jgi:hypothetical protein
LSPEEVVVVVVAVVLAEGGVGVEGFPEDSVTGFVAGAGAGSGLMLVAQKLCKAPGEKRKKKEKNHTSSSTGPKTVFHPMFSEQVFVLSL